MVLVGIAILSALVWLYLFLLHGNFWQIRRIVAVAPTSRGKPLRIAVVVPARDEADVVGRAITSLLNQSGGHAIHVFLVDDASSDSTAEIARAAAHAAGKSELLNVIEGEPLPSGWSGKLWAVKQGIDRAQTFHPDFFLLTDADIEHAPDSLETLA